MVSNRSRRALKNTVRTQRSRTNRVLFDALEDRRLFTLIPIAPLLGYPQLQADNPGIVSYAAGSGDNGSLHAGATTIAVLTSPTTFTFIQPSDRVAQGVDLDVQIKKSDGSFAGGVAGWDLEVRGKVTIDSQVYDGVLLVGEATQFGFADSGNSFDFRFTLDGGLLAGLPAYAGKDLGVVLNRTTVSGQTSPQPFPNLFNFDFGGGAKVFVGPIPTLSGPPLPASLAGVKFQDITGDGFSTDDTPLANVTINLFQDADNDGLLTAADGAAISSVLTAADGSYKFENLPTPGRYFVQEGASTTYIQTAGPAYYTVTPAEGEDVTGLNFDNFKKITVSGTKYKDLTGNSFSADDTPLAGITINLYNDADHSTPIATTTTGTDGSYAFADLGPGTYFVQEVLPAGYTQTGGAAGYTIAATSGLASANNNFANYALQPSIDIEKYVNPEVTPLGGEGLTPGFWKQSQHFYAWTNYHTTDSYNAIFGVNDPDGASLTLLDALARGGGANNALGRHAVSALLNAANPNVSYLYSAGQIISLVQNAYATGNYDYAKNLLAQQNELEADLSTPAVFTPSAPGYGYDADLPGSGPTVLAGTQLTFTFVVTNPGQTPLMNVVVTDDNASPGNTADDFHPTYVSGDTNHDSILDLNETWVYTYVTTALAGSHTNTATVVGTNIFNPSQQVTDADAANYDTSSPPAPGIDVEKTTNGPTNSNPTAPDYDNEDAANGPGVPTLTPGSAVTWTYKVTNTGNVPFTAGQIALVDDNGTASTADDFSIANGQITFLSVLVGDADNILEPGESWLYKASGTVQNLTAAGGSGSSLTFDFSGNSSTNGTDGNVRTFTAGSVSVHASAFSRDSYGNWSAAYLGSYGGGLGVTDSGEGSGSNNTHTVDNSGRDNYVLLEFSESVVLDSAYLGYVVGDSDMTVWIGTLPGAFDSHVTLSDSFLASLGFTEVNTTSSSSARTANLNAGGVAGNVIVIAARIGDCNDYFKVETVKVNKTVAGTYENKATVTVPGGSDSDLSHYRNSNSAPPKTSIAGTKFRDVTGNGLTADDVPLAGVTIKLYKDVNGDGKLTSADGSAIKSTTTSSSGAYAFSDLAPGNYLVQEVVTSDYVRTGPTLQDYYAVPATTAGETYTGYDFANYDKNDCFCAFGSYYFLVNGKKVSDLRGNTNQGDKVQVVFTVKNGYSNVQVSLVSYYAPSASFDADTAYLQQVYQSQTGTYGPGTHTLTVYNPDCYYQVDFVCGAVIDHFGPANSNIFYTPQNRLISADNDGCNACFCGTASIAGSVFADKNNNGIFESSESGISGVRVHLTGVNDLGQAVDVWDTTDSRGAYSFTGLRAGTYSVAETQPSSYNDGKDALGTGALSVGSLANDLFSGIQIATGNKAVNYNFGEIVKSSSSSCDYDDRNDRDCRDDRDDRYCDNDRDNDRNNYDCGDNSQSASSLLSFFLKLLSGWC